MKRQGERGTWRSTLLPIGSTIQEAVANLDASGLKIVLVVEENDTLIGTLSDGDIRRALLNGKTLQDPIDTAVNRSPLVVSPDFNSVMVQELMFPYKVVWTCRASWVQDPVMYVLELVRS